jgi:hypothetical protein
MKKPNPTGLARPCPECPFSRGPKAVRLHPERAREIAKNMLSFSGKIFWCHKTTTTGGASRGRRQHCAGAFIFAEKNGMETQPMRIAKRLRIYPELTGREEVFSTVAQMVKASR